MTEPRLHDFCRFCLRCTRCMGDLADLHRETLPRFCAVPPGHRHRCEDHPGFAAGAKIAEEAARLMESEE